MAPHRQAMNDCARGSSSNDEEASGSVRIHLAASGKAIGAEVSGAGAFDPAVEDCLRRQAAAVIFPPLDEGDYATVRYDYQVTP